jgi:hypothetical protein
MSGLVSRLSIRAKVIVACALIPCGTVGPDLLPVQRLDSVIAMAADLRVG